MISMSEESKELLLMTKRRDLRTTLILEKQFLNKLNQETPQKRDKEFQSLIQMINQRLLWMKRSKNKDLRMILMLVKDLKLFRITRNDQKMIQMSAKMSFQSMVKGKKELMLKRMIIRKLRLMRSIQLIQ